MENDKTYYNKSNLKYSKNALKLPFFVLLSVILFECNQIKTRSDMLNKSDSTIFSHYATIDSIDYFTICDSLSRWQGGIQGIDVSDSTKTFPFAECHTNKAFDLIWVPKGDILKFKSLVGQDSLHKLYIVSEKDNFKKFDCYSFVIPKTKPKPQKRDCDCQGDAFDYVFPSEVKVFKRMDNGWKLVKEKHIKTFEELGRLKLNTIFQLD